MHDGLLWHFAEVFAHNMPSIKSSTFNALRVMSIVQCGQWTVDNGHCVVMDARNVTGVAYVFIR
jgi:hypothetical protein